MWETEGERKLVRERERGVDEKKKEKVRNKEELKNAYTGNRWGEFIVTLKSVLLDKEGEKKIGLVVVEPPPALHFTALSNIILLYTVHTISVCDCVQEKLGIYTAPSLPL